MNAATVTTEASERMSLPRPLRIVVADDNRDAVLTLVTLLRDEGHDVRGAYRSDQVLPLARSFKPQVMILDIAMPGRSGYELAQAIRASHYGARRPLLIAITGEYKRPADVLMSKAAGFDHHLTKPYDPVTLLGLLKPLTLPDEDSESD